MKTKTIPFDLETAKKIQDGKIEGKIVCKEDDLLKPARIICWDKRPSYPIVALVSSTSDYESIICFGYKGNSEHGSCELYIKLSTTYNEPQFKPFDKVLVRNDGGIWCCAFFSHIDYSLVTPTVITTDNNAYKQCIPYEGNEHLVGTTDNPNEQ